MTREPLYFVPAWAVPALTAYHGGTLPDYYQVLQDLPRHGGIAPREYSVARAEFRAVPRPLFICMHAATREHDPFPAAPQAHTWTFAAALLMCMQTLDRMAGTSVSTSTQGAIP